MLGGWLLLGEPLTGLKLGGVTSGVVAVLLMYAAGRVAGAAPATTNKAGYRPTGGDGVELQRLEEEEAEASGGEEGGSKVAGSSVPTSPHLAPSPPAGTSYYYLIAILASALAHST